MQGSCFEILVSTAFVRLKQEFCQPICAREVPALLTDRVEHRGTPNAYNVAVVVHGLPREALLLGDGVLPVPSTRDFLAVVDKAAQIEFE